MQILEVCFYTFYLSCTALKVYLLPHLAQIEDIEIYLADQLKLCRQSDIKYMTRGEWNIYLGSTEL